MTNEERRVELGFKILKMGDALIAEGKDSKDGCVIQVGSTLQLLSGIITSEEDMFIFGELIAMFTAKKIMDEMREVEKPKISDDLISAIISSIKNISNKKEINEVVKKPRKPRKKKGDNDEPESGS